MCFFSGWGATQIFYFIFTPENWGRVPIWLIFFRWVETTNQFCFESITIQEFFLNAVSKLITSFMTLVLKEIPSSPKSTSFAGPFLKKMTHLRKGSMVSYTATMSSCGQGAEWQRSMIYLEQMDLKRLPRDLYAPFGNHIKPCRTCCLEIHRSPKPHQWEDLNDSWIFAERTVKCACNSRTGSQ